MPDINTPYTFSADFLTRLKLKFPDGSIDHKLWGDKDIEDIRKEIRNHYRTIQSGQCAYCKKPVSIRSANNCHIEHIVPKSLQPNFIYESKNLCVICADCNEIKRSQEVRSQPHVVTKNSKPQRYPRASASYIIMHPHFDDYDKHIDNFEDIIYVGLTTKGENTVTFCDLNRKYKKFGIETDKFDLPTILAMLRQILNTKEKAMQQKEIQRLTKFLLIYSK